MSGEKKPDEEHALVHEEDPEITAVGSSISAELFRMAVKQSHDQAGRLDDGATWLLSLAVAGILENFAFDALCGFAAEVGRRRCDPTLDLAKLIEASAFEKLRGRQHEGQEARATLEERFCARMRNLYLSTVNRARKR